MSPRRGVSGVTALAVAAIVVGLAGTAQADPPLLNGTYDIVGGSDEFNWTATSDCAAEECAARIASNRGWTSVATLTGGRWNFTVSKPDGFICDDGQYAAMVAEYSIDSASLTGTVTVDANGTCPGDETISSPLQLRRVA